VADFVNAPDVREVIFTRQATEALNLVAYAWGLNNLGPGDLVVVTELEHHSNFVPWQYMADKTGAGFRMLHVTDEGELDLSGPDEAERDGNAKVVAANLGGHMISKGRYEATTWGELPHKFEAGTSPIAEAVGLGAAIDYLNEVGIESIEAHEQELAAVALERLGEIEGVTLYGPPPERRAGIVSFNGEG